VRGRGAPWAIAGLGAGVRGASSPDGPLGRAETPFSGRVLAALPIPDREKNRGPAGFAVSGGRERFS
jgi:hypothetical protein